MPTTRTSKTFEV